MAELASILTPNSDADTELAAQLIREWSTLSSDRSMFETQWQEVSELVDPNQSRSFRGEWINRGEKRTQKQYDNTAGIALDRFVAILDSLLTPNGQTWHSLKTGNDTLDKNKQVQDYLYDLNKKLFATRYAYRANFVEANQSVWQSIGSLGTGIMYIDQIWGQKGVRYKFVPLGNMYLMEDHQGRFCAYYRKYRYTAHQAMMEFGASKLPVEIVKNAQENPEMRYDFLQVVRRRNFYDPSKLDKMNMPWESFDISIVGNTILDKGGFRSCPFIGTRYAVSLEEQYGRSPAMRVLPTIKTLNEAKKAFITQSHRAMNPVNLTHDDGVLSNLALHPGAINPGGVSADGKVLVHQMMPGNIQVGKENMDDDRADIKSAFMTDLFQILMETPEMTATEVMERVKEKGILISPSVSRQEQYLGDVIEREIDLMIQQGQILPPPKIMRDAGSEYKIQFESPLSKMRRAEEAAGFMRVLEQALQISQAAQDPSIMHYFNFDEAMPALAEIGGVPSKWMNTMEKVDQLRKAQAQAQAQQQLIQAGPGAAAVLKALPQGAGGQ
jgi:hypothetical protein